MMDAVQVWTLIIAVVLFSTTLSVAYVLFHAMAAIRHVETRIDNQNYRIEAISHQLAHHQHSKDN